MPSAARVGDLTAHGGAIVAGAASVFIEGTPAARQGDVHVCPMCNPGTPPPPHVGGPIAMGATTVFIEGMPAARMGDMCVCSGPPDVIAMGAATVMIGDAAGGGAKGSGSGGRDFGAQAARYSAVAAESLAPEVTDLREPFFAAQVTSGSGAPIAKAQSSVKNADGNESRRRLPGNGQVRSNRLPSEQDHEVSLQQVHTVRWSTEEARVGDEVKITAKVSGIDDGTEVMIRINQLTVSGSGSDTVYVMTALVSGGSVKAGWAYAQTYDRHASPEVDDRVSVCHQMPVYRAEVVLADAGLARCSGLLTFQDHYRLQVCAESSDEPIPDRPYKLLMTNGEVREGKTDAEGWIDEEGVPPGDHKVIWEK